MGKIGKSFYMEKECVDTLARMSNTLTTIAGRKVSEAVVVELLLSMVNDEQFTVEGMTLEPLVVGYYTTKFNRKDRRRKDV